MSPVSAARTPSIHGVIVSRFFFPWNVQSPPSDGPDRLRDPWQAAVARYAAT